MIDIDLDSAPKTDFLAHCYTPHAQSATGELLRDQGPEALLCVYRLAKTALIHAVENQALIACVSQAHEFLQSLGQALQSRVTLTFVGETVFINAQLLRASREVYEHALELGSIFKRCGVTEVAFELSLTTQDLTRFASLLALSLQDQQHKGALGSENIPNIVLRKVDPLLERQEAEADAPLRDQVLKAYAAAVLVMRQYYEAVAQGAPFPLHRVKRLAHRLVTLSLKAPALMLGMLTMVGVHRDDAGRSVHSAIMALGLGQQITHDRVSLAHLTMAALVAECGRIKLLGAHPHSAPVLPETLETSIPPATAAVCLTQIGVTVPGALRTVVLHETTWFERESLLGPVHARRMTLLLQSHILWLVRAVLGRLVPRDASAPMSTLDAIGAAATSPQSDPLLVRLLMRAFGLVPIGSVLEFDSGEWAVVVGPSANAEALDRPCVRLLTDRQGRSLESPKLLDLGSSSQGRAYARIAYVVSPDQARFNVTYPLLTV